MCHCLSDTLVGIKELMDPRIVEDQGSLLSSLERVALRLRWITTHINPDDADAQVVCRWMFAKGFLNGQTAAKTNQSRGRKDRQETNFVFVAIEMVRQRSD